jgi:hypothetical protein
MRKLLLVAVLSLSLSAYAEATRDANPPDKENTQGANTDAIAADPATKARVRVEGAAGGTGARIPEEARGEATVGSGRQHRQAKPPDEVSYEAAKGRRHDETSSDREEGRGARRSGSFSNDPRIPARNYFSPKGAIQ